MASLPAKIFDFQANEPIPSSAPLDDEYDNIYHIFDGTTTGTKLLTKTSDATDPVYEFDQVGAGPIVEFKQNGTLKASINNSGQIVSEVATGTAPFDVDSTTKVTNLNADKVDGFDLAGDRVAWTRDWFIQDPSTFTVGEGSALGVWIVPAGNSIAVTKIKVVYYSGSHTSGGDVQFVHIFKNSTGGSSAAITSLHLDNTNNTVLTTYSANFAANLTEGDQISLIINSRSGTITERNVSISLHGTQKFTT